MFQRKLTVNMGWCDAQCRSCGQTMAEILQTFLAWPRKSVPAIKVAVVKSRRSDNRSENRKRRARFHQPHPSMLWQCLAELWMLTYHFKIDENFVIKYISHYHSYFYFQINYIKKFMSYQYQLYILQLVIGAYYVWALLFFHKYLLTSYHAFISFL